MKRSKVCLGEDGARNAAYQKGGVRLDAVGQVAPSARSAARARAASRMRARTKTVPAGRGGRVEGRSEKE